MALPERLEEIVEEFADLPGNLRLEALLDYSRRVPPLPPELAANRDALEQVHECQTPFFVATELRDAVGGQLRRHPLRGAERLQRRGGAGDPGDLLRLYGPGPGGLAAAATWHRGHPREAEAPGARQAGGLPRGAGVGPGPPGRRGAWPAPGSRVPAAARPLLAPTAPARSCRACRRPGSARRPAPPGPGNR